LTDAQTQLLRRVKEVVLALEPAAQVILYGSRVREAAAEDSDWDILVLLEGAVDDSRTDLVRHALYEIEWETGSVLSSVVMSTADWNAPRFRVTPFYQSVQREGAVL